MMPRGPMAFEATLNSLMKWLCFRIAATALPPESLCKVLKWQALKWEVLEWEVLKSKVLGEVLAISLSFRIAATTRPPEILPVKWEVLPSAREVLPISLKHRLTLWKRSTESLPVDTVRLYRGISLIRKRPPPQDPPMTLGIGLR
jgi:hypothetical protein